MGNTKSAESQGVVANTVEIESDGTTRLTVILLFILVIIKLGELIFKIYYAHRRGLRKRYLNQSVNTIS